jgi:hypothetical protein
MNAGEYVLLFLNPDFSDCSSHENNCISIREAWRMLHQVMGNNFDFYMKTRAYSLLESVFRECFRELDVFTPSNTPPAKSSRKSKFVTTFKNVLPI